MSSTSRIIAVLGLFDETRPVWSAEQAAAVLGVSVSTAYRYFNSLVKAGLLDPVAGSGYRLGPAIIELDRHIRRCDPLLRVSRPVMAALHAEVGTDSAVILCRLYRDRVMCVHEESVLERAIGVGYERGRPMSMFRGATSKIILAYLPPRVLRRHFEQHASEIEDSGLGATWPEFQSAMRALRRQGHCVTEGEVDGGYVGVGAPVFAADERVVGSLSVVGRAEYPARPDLAAVTPLTVEAARSVSEGLAASDPSAAPFTPRAAAVA